MSAAVNPEPGLCWDEVRYWAEGLQLFTASTLADTMGTDLKTAQRCVTALIYQGMCADTGDVVDGPFGYEPIITYKELPPGPTQHPRGPDVVATAVRELGRGFIAVERGMPVRRSASEARGARRKLSTPGQAQKMKNREREYNKQQEAKAAAAAAQKAKTAKPPKWQRKKK